MDSTVLSLDIGVVASPATSTATLESLLLMRTSRGDSRALMFHNLALEKFCFLSDCHSYSYTEPGLPVEYVLPCLVIKTVSYLPHSPIGLLRGGGSQVM